MISRILPAQEADTVALDFGVFVAKQSRTHRVSQSVIIAALRPYITPSQPIPQAPAARVSEPSTPDTQAEVSAPQTFADHSPETAHEIDRDVQRGNADPAVAAENAREAIPSVEDGSVIDAEAGESPAAGDQTGKSGEASASPASSREDQMLALFTNGGQPTALEAANALGYAHSSGAVRLAAKLGLTLRKVSTEELVANGRRARAKQVEQQQAKKAATTEALKAAPAKPQEVAERAGPPTPRSEPSPPPRPPVEADASDVLHRVKKAPSGRFYLRDKATLEFVHQSLAPSPNGSGPMMTKDRKWAWYATMQRYRGARKRWPELADMRKEAGAQ